ncbi:AAA family ATPase [Dongia sp.]|uniref:AAA family ATPase n=1 Tax=Dongia sp. TaxID=1977262 RepID=UPI0035B2CC6F
MIHRFSIEAFPQTKDTEAALQGLTAEREFAKSKLTIHFGGMSRAAKHYVDNPSPQFILVEENGSSEDIHKGLEALAEVVEPGRKVIVIGTVNDVQAYRQLINQGVSEYLVGPVTTADIAAAITSCVKDASATPKGKVISFIGSRGGVGSSTLAVNAAWTMAQATQEEIIGIDLDFNFGTMALALNLDPKQAIADALVDADRIDAVLIERFLTEHSPHFSILSTAGSLKDMSEPSPEAVERLIDICRSMAQYVIIDLPRHWSSWVSSVLLLSDETVVVANPDLANLRDAKMLFDWLKGRRGNSLNRFILNKADVAKRNQLSGKDFQDTLGMPPVLTVGFDPTLFAQLANNGQMVGEGAKAHKLNEQLRHLAQQLGGRKSGLAQPQSAPKFLSWLKRPAKQK